MQYRLELFPGQTIDRNGGLIVMAPKFGMPMIIKKQDRNFARYVGDFKANVREMVELPQ